MIVVILLCEKCISFLILIEKKKKKKQTWIDLSWIDLNTRFKRTINKCTSDAAVTRANTLFYLNWAIREKDYHVLYSTVFYFNDWCRYRLNFLRLKLKMVLLVIIDTSFKKDTILDAQSQCRSWVTTAFLNGPFAPKPLMTSTNSLPWPKTQ